jgi:hypothetical protein
MKFFSFKENIANIRNSVVKYYKRYVKLPEGLEMQRKHVIGAAVAVVLMAAVFAGAYLWMDTRMKDNSSAKNPTTQAGSETADADTENEKTLEIAKHIHLMSNSLIIAGDKQVWGSEEVNKENVEKVIKLLDEGPDNSDTRRMRAIIERWQQGDFSQIVDDHNFAWDLLGGTVGRASGANQEAVDNAAANMKSAAQ